MDDNQSKMTNFWFKILRSKIQKLSWLPKRVGIILSPDREDFWSSSEFLKYGKLIWNACKLKGYTYVLTNNIFPHNRFRSLQNKFARKSMTLISQIVFPTRFSEIAIIGNKVEDIKNHLRKISKIQPHLPGSMETA